MTNQLQKSCMKHSSSASQVPNALEFFSPGIFLNKHTIPVQDNSLVYLDVLHSFSANISSSQQLQLFPEIQHILDEICGWQLKKKQPPIAICDIWLDRSSLISALCMNLLSNHSNDTLLKPAVGLRMERKPWLYLACQWLEFVMKER